MTLQRSTDPLVWIDCEVNHTESFTLLCSINLFRYSVMGLLYYD